MRVFLLVYKVAKRQVSSSIRQPRRAGNRNRAPAAMESTTIVSRLFEGQLGYMTLCMHCDHQTHRTQTFTVLSLPIPTDIIKCSIQVGLPVNTCRCRFAPNVLQTVSMRVQLRLSGVSASVLCVLCAGLLVSFLRADPPDRGRADAVLGVWAEERNGGPHLFGQTSRNPHVAPETVGGHNTSS